MFITATRFHDFSAGHRVAGHESKCAYLHGHNYRIHFTVRTDALDVIGRVMDFSIIDTRLCQWLEKSWDHKFLAWAGDGLVKYMLATDDAGAHSSYQLMLDHSIVWTPFNPTAENMAAYLLNEVGPGQLKGTSAQLIKVVVEETRKCSATAEL